MAIDTADKRASAGPGLEWLGIGPAPDGTIDAADRAHSAAMYRGIATGAPSISYVHAGGYVFLPAPPSGDPWLMQLHAILMAEMSQRQPQILGWRHDGTNLHVRFRSSIGTSWIQVHVQTTDAGEGGSGYDSANYKSTTLVDCRSDRVQNVTVADIPYGRSFVFLIPVDYDGAGIKVLYDGLAGRPDFMSFVDIGV